MKVLDFEYDRAFAEIKRLCYSGVDSVTLRDRALERMRKVVPFDGYVAFTMDPSNGLITHATVEAMGDESGLRHFLEHVYFDDHVLDFSWMAQHRIPAALLSEATGGKPEHALRFRELLGPAGFAHEMRGALTTGIELWGGLCLSRGNGHADFGDREVAFLRRVSSYLGAGLRMATLQSELGNDQDADDGSAGVLMLDQQGRVVQHNAAAECRLRELGELGQSWREGAGLPMQVWTVLGALHRAMNPATDRDFTSEPQLHVRGRGGRWLTLQASRTEPDALGASVAVVVIAPSGPREVFRLSTIGYGLTSREREVVELVVRGASSRQIAQALYISEHTVKDHLDHIFEKVGARGRREVVKRLYLNTLFS
jgi:DNA-binding CsgD family transcriptional regulator